MVDVEIPDGKELVAVLALVAIAEHDVLPRQTHRGATNSFVSTQVKHARHSQCSAHDGQTIVFVAYGKTPPRTEIVQFTSVVQGMRGIAEEQQKCASRGGDVNGMKVLVQRENWQRQRIATAGRMKRGNVVIDFERLIEMPERIIFVCITRLIERLGILSPWHASECSSNQ